MAKQGRDATNRILAESFHELVIKQPIEKITIKEITERAGVIRPTFYNHFQDKYELLEWIIQTDLMEPMKPLLSNGMTHEALVLLFTNIEKDKAFYIQASKLEGQNSFKSIAQDCVEQVLLSVIHHVTQGKKPQNEWLTLELIAEYYAHSMCYITLRWIESGMSITPRELAEVYDYVIKHSMDDILEDISIQNAPFVAQN